ALVEGLHHARTELRPHPVDHQRSAEQQERCVQLLAPRDLPLGERVLTLLCRRGFRALLHRAVGHQRPPPVEKASSACPSMPSWNADQPVKKAPISGIDAAKTSSPTPIWIGKATASTFSCGAARPSTARATFASSTVAITGAASRAA